MKAHRHQVSDPVCLECREQGGKSKEAREVEITESLECQSLRSWMILLKKCQVVQTFQ